MADDTPVPVEQLVVELVKPVTKADDESSAAATGTGTGTATPAMTELPPDQVAYSLKVSLADLCAKAAVLYSQQKNYEEAAELYARAAEMQAEINGEMDPENAEILFLYGRALFKVGQSKSDVLGGKAPETDGAAKGGKKTSEAKSEKKKTEGGIIAGAISAGASKDSQPSAGPSDAKKPLFQFSGDEEWDASDDEDEEGGGENGEDEDDDGEEEDDLAVAFEVLDLSRVLFEKQLAKIKADGGGDDAAAEKDEANGKEAKEEAAEAAEAKEGENGEKEDKTTEKAKGPSGPHRHILERLADTHDLLAEISLENERYPNAIVDSRASLGYKKQFLPEESELVAEAHFKLSLALEFASVTTSGDDGAGGEKQAQQVDQELRDEAVRELEAAIASTKLKLQNKEVELATLHSPEDNDASRRQITDVKEIISDMEQRLIDLRKPPIDLNAAVNGPAGAGLGGLLGALGGGGGGAAGGSSVDVAEAKKGAKDLTGLVRKKAKDTGSGGGGGAASAPSPVVSESNGTKRKADEPAAGSDDDTKKARTAAA